MNTWACCYINLFKHSYSLLFKLYNLNITITLLFLFTFCIITMQNNIIDEKYCIIHYALFINQLCHIYSTWRFKTGNTVFFYTTHHLRFPTTQSDNQYGLHVAYGLQAPIAYSERVCQDFCKDSHSLTAQNIPHKRVNESWNQRNAITAGEKQINTSCAARVLKAAEQGDLWPGWWIRAASNRWPVQSTVHLLAIEKWALLPLHRAVSEFRSTLGL